ncbi:MAG: adenylate cyclase [Candidatus Sumerlaeia bacterium]
MPIEVERKFLVYKDRLPELIDGEHFIQGYLSTDPQVRFRIIESTVIIGIKKVLGDGDCYEFEFPRHDMSARDIRVMKSLAMWPPLEKTRYRVPHADLVWEIDVYGKRNTGLITADVELPYRSYDIDFPDWVREDGEITGNPYYTNVSLTREPIDADGQANVHRFRSFHI